MSDTKMTCAICQDDFSDGAADVCGSGHHWCQDCLRASVVAAHRNATDPTVTPPRCCGVPVFPTDTIFDARDHPVLRFLDAESLELWRVATLRAREAASGYVHVDGDIIRMARRARHPNLYQFCQRCSRLVNRVEGCNHMTCICRHEFCMICGETWPPDMQQPTDNEQPPGLCHKFFGDDDKHILHIPAEVQARLDAQAEIPPPAISRDRTGILCNHHPRIIFLLRLRRALDEEERERARCDVCGTIFRAFLLQCRGCATLLCLECRDRLVQEEELVEGGRWGGG